MTMIHEVQHRLYQKNQYEIIKKEVKNEKKEKVI